jgi:hypothetical protein
MRYTTFPLKLGRQCLLYLLSFAVILLVAEGLLRIKANTQHIDDIVYIKRDGLVFMEPNSDQVVSGGNFKPIHVVTNSDGFATPNTTLIPPTGTVRIAFMGNSFTKGFEVDYTKKFTSRVEQLLNETNSGKKLTYEVMNFGNGGYSFVEQLLIYEQYVKKYHPQYVFLITFPPTDFFRNHAFEYKQDYLLSTPIEKITNKELFSDASFLNSTSSTAKIWQLSIFARKISSGIFEKINKIEHGNNTIVKKIITPFNPLLTKWGVINNEISQKDNQYIDETFLYMDPESERITDEEKKDLEALMGYFDLSPKDFEFNQNNFNKFYSLALIDKGILPTPAHTGLNVIFKKDEVLHWLCGATLKKQKRVTESIGRSRK